jgi:hypothetical protein
MFVPFMFLYMRRDRRSTRPAYLSDLAREKVDVWCWCESCRHSAVIATAMLIEKLGPSYPVPQVAIHLRCSGCGSRDVFARPDWPSLGVIVRRR